MEAKFTDNILSVINFRYEGKNKVSIFKISVRKTEPATVLILYGSYARNDYRDDSDLDLLVLVDKDEITQGKVL